MAEIYNFVNNALHISDLQKIMEKWYFIMVLRHGCYSLVVFVYRGYFIVLNSDGA
jgi:hypothetical protein